MPRMYALLGAAVTNQRTHHPTQHLQRHPGHLPAARGLGPSSGQQCRAEARGAGEEMRAAAPGLPGAARPEPGTAAGGSALRGAALRGASSTAVGNPRRTRFPSSSQLGSWNKILKNNKKKKDSESRLPGPALPCTPRPCAEPQPGSPSAPPRLLCLCRRLLLLSAGSQPVLPGLAAAAAAAISASPELPLPLPGSRWERDGLRSAPPGGAAPAAAATPPPLGPAGLRAAPTMINIYLWRCSFRRSFQPLQKCTIRSFKMATGELLVQFWTSFFLF